MITVVNAVESISNPENVVGIAPLEPGREVSKMIKVGPAKKKTRTRPRVSGRFSSRSAYTHNVSIKKARCGGQPRTGSTSRSRQLGEPDRARWTRACWCTEHRVHIFLRTKRRLNMEGNSMHHVMYQERIANNPSRAEFWTRGRTVAVGALGKIEDGASALSNSITATDLPSVKVRRINWPWVWSKGQRYSNWSITGWTTTAG